MNDLNEGKVLKLMSYIMLGLFAWVTYFNFQGVFIRTVELFESLPLNPVFKNLHILRIYMQRLNLAQKPDKRHDWLRYATGKRRRKGTCGSFWPSF